MRASEAKDQHQFSAGARAGWEAALLEIEPAGEFDDAVDRLLAADADGSPEVPS